MNRRGRPIAVKLLVLLLVPLMSLAGLWAFAAGLTGGAGLRLLEIDNLVTNLANPAEQINIQLQRERLVSVEYLAGRQKEAVMTGQRAVTDQTVAMFRGLASRQRDVSPEMAAQLSELTSELDRIPEIRAKIDERDAGMLQVVSTYSRTVDATFRMYDQMVLVPDVSLYRQARAVNMMGEAKEMLSRERAVLVAVIAAGKVGDAERAMFAELVATRRLLYAQALNHLDLSLRDSYAQLANTPVYLEFIRAEDAVRGPASSTGLPATAVTWTDDGDNLWAVVERHQFEAVQSMTKRVTPAAANILIKIGVAGGLGLIAVVASVLLSLRFRQRLVQELAGLRDTATELADVRLAGLIERLRKGSGPVEGRAAPLDVQATTSEVLDIVQAFNGVQSTAVDAAIGQARLREGVSKVFVNLARRNQSLLHRQLLQLDDMQRNTENPDTLEDLFKLDHLTTRMRRHAESLIILSEQTPGRGWRNPVAIVDVLRAAVAEVEDYSRIEVPQPPKVSLAGPAVTDVVHLIAELVENATMYSPPQTRVDVRCVVAPGGLVIEIEDRGLGLQRAELDQLNERLVDMPEFDLAESDRLGLFVVARLAARHGIRVSLRSSPYGGVCATVILPAKLLAAQPALA